MEYLQMAEEIHQRSEIEPETITNFKSVFSINGHSILSPLMTPEKRLEMQKLRQAAIELEQQIGQRPKQPYAGSARECESMNDSVRNCCQKKNASTNTEIELELVLRPVTVVGRVNQRLQLSETLIYDNRCNAIIKFIKPNFSRRTSVQYHVVQEEFRGSLYQQAVIILPPVKYGILANTSLETVEPLSKRAIADTQSKPLAPSAAKPSPDLEETRKNDREASRVESLRQVRGVATRRDGEQLERSITSPVLRQTMERSERLHPLLWKRYYSYPSTCGSDVKKTAGIESLHAPTTKQLPTKIQVKQQHSTPVQHAQTPNQPNSGSPQSKRINKSVNRTTRTRSSISYSAHASSHANEAVQQTRKDGSTRISSTQRRLNYDPRATIKRAGTLKKTESSASCVARVPLTNSSSNSNFTATASLTSAQIKCQMQEMEQQQHRRFQLLVSQQAEEQKRMQKEFLVQQQTLMEQMICDMAGLSLDKDTQSDAANSESSSINSLPQSRLDLQIDEP